MNIYTLQTIVWRHMRFEVEVSKSHHLILMHITQHAPGTGLTTNLFHVSNCLLELFCCPNWPFWCTSFDVGWKRVKETVKPVKEAGILSSSLFSPAADGNTEPNMLALQKYSHMHKPTYIYIYSAGPKQKLCMLSKTSNSKSDALIGQDCARTKNREMWGFEGADETETWR